MSQLVRECLWLIPYSGLEDFPESFSSRDSQQLLSGWLALWHPSLIASTHCAPRWQSASQFPADRQGVVASVPECSLAKLSSELAAVVSPTAPLTPDADDAASADAGHPQSAGLPAGWLTPVDTSWRTLQSRLLTELKCSHPPEAIASQWQLEFAALGYAYLQIQLLTRQLRYSSNLDQLLFDSQLDQAAQAVLAGDCAEAEKMLQSCFDQLGQERDHYYSLDVSLLDVTLLAETSTSVAVSAQLARQLPTSFVASANTLRHLGNRHPEIPTLLKEAIEQRRASLAGGLDRERPHPLMDFDSLKRDLERGREAYQGLGLSVPQVFTRYSFGQLSDMPLHLRRSGFIGSLLIAWCEGSYPAGSHAKFSWEAAEGTFINALAPALADAHDASTFLTLGKRIAEALDHQHVPVFMLAHWPDAYSEFFELLLRVVARTPALGRWLTVDDFFENTDQPYHQEQLPPRKFVFDWLAQRSPAGGTSPSADALIMTCLHHQRLTTRLRTLQNLLNLSYQLEHFASRPAVAALQSASASHVPDASLGESQPNAQLDELLPRGLSLAELDKELAAAADKIDALWDAPQSAEADAAAIDAHVSGLTQAITSRLARAAGQRVIAANPAGPATGTRPASLWVANPASAAQRLAVASAISLAPQADAPWLYASGPAANERLSMIDVPAFGVLRIPLQTAGDPPRRQPTLIPNEGLLINDFLEAQIDPRSGGLRSLHMPGKRGNRLSVQLARRETATGAEAEYSQSQVTSLTAIENTAVRATIRAQGQLLFRGQTSGQFEIDYCLLRGSRILKLHIRLHTLAALSGSSWQSAYVLRTAWPSEAAVVNLVSCGVKQTWSAGKGIAPSLIEIDEADYKTYLLTGGLAFHQRSGPRFMETILSTGNPARGEFSFGIGVDLPNPVVASKLFYESPCVVAVESPAVEKSPAPSASWLMHVDAKHVVMDLESPLVDQHGRCVGLRVHLSETMGKSVTAHIRSLREVAEAHRVDYRGGRIAKLTAEGDVTSIAMRPHEMTFVDLLWK